MTPPTGSWPATTGRRWRKYFSTSPAAASRKAHRERTRSAGRYRAASHQRDDSALLVPAALVVAASARTDIFAGGAVHPLGLSGDLHFAERRIFCGIRRALAR